MIYDNKFGKELAQKYLGKKEFETRLEHTRGVAEFAYLVAQKIKNNNPELINFNPELVGFLGWTHDLGYSVDAGKHEVHSIDILINKEGIPKNIAQKVMHGQLAEQFGTKEDNIEQYLPQGIEGMILTYADMSVRTGSPISLKERAAEIIERINKIPTMSDTLKQEIANNLNNALPRFEKYESTILKLANVSSADELIRPTISFMYKHFKKIYIPEDFIERARKKQNNSINIDIKLRMKGLDGSRFFDKYDANIIFATDDEKKSFTMQKFELTLAPSNEEINNLMIPVIESAKKYATLAIENGLQVRLNNREYNPKIEFDVGYTIHK